MTKHDRQRENETTDNESDADEVLGVHMQSITSNAGSEWYHGDKKVR